MPYLSAGTKTGNVAETDGALPMHPTRVKLALLLTLPVLLAGCEHAMWGNVTALGMTFGLFFGTLQLGKRAPPRVDTGTAQPAASVATK